MRQLVLALLALLTVSVGGQASAQTETLWDGWGREPFATSPEEAIRRLPDALRLLNVPEAVRPLLEAAVAADPDGEEHYVVPGDRFVAMMSEHDVVLPNVVVAKIPVKLPDGKTGVSRTANARKWEVTHEGRIYVLVLPEICNNWAWASREAPVRQEECATVTYSDIKVGMTYHVAVLARGPLSPSVCWARKEGSGEWEVWPDECSDCVWEDAQASIQTHRQVSTQVRQSGKSVATATGVTLRVPLSVARRDFIATCLEDDGKQSREKYVEPSDFGRSNHYSASPFRW